MLLLDKRMQRGVFLSLIISNNDKLNTNKAKILFILFKILVKINVLTEHELIKAQNNTKIMKS